MRTFIYCKVISNWNCDLMFSCLCFDFIFKLLCCVLVFLLLLLCFFFPQKWMLQLLGKEYTKAEQKFSIIILCASVMVDSLRRLWRVTELEQLWRNAVRVVKNVDWIFWFRKKWLKEKIESCEKKKVTMEWFIHCSHNTRTRAQHEIARKKSKRKCLLTAQS